MSVDAGRIEIGIGEAVVDGGQAGGAGIAEQGDLDGGGFAGEDEQAVVGGVQGEVDEDVDLVVADLVGGLFVGEADDVAPVVGVGSESGGDGVGAGDLGVSRRFRIAA